MKLARSEADSTHAVVSDIEPGRASGSFQRSICGSLHIGTDGRVPGINAKNLQHSSIFINESPLFRRDGPDGDDVGPFLESKMGLATQVDRLPPRTFRQSACWRGRSVLSWPPSISWLSAAPQATAAQICRDFNCARIRNQSDGLQHLGSFLFTRRR